MNERYPPRLQVGRHSLHHGNLETTKGFNARRRETRNRNTYGSRKNFESFGQIQTFGGKEYLSRVLAGDNDNGVLEKEE